MENSNLKQVFIVSENKEESFYLYSLLKQNENSNITIFDRAKKALKDENLSSCDLLITSLYMSNMNGFDLYSNLKKQNYTFPIVAITPLEPKSIKNSEPGFTEVIRKTDHYSINQKILENLIHD